jgi:S-(hydroxymethyl)glutathione dehydrogenase/alcohol dehydrogenase
MKTEAALLVETGKPLVLARIAMPSLKPGQVLVEIAFSGVCGTQLMEIAGSKGEDKWCPHCLGHEGAGTVMEAGPGVTKVKAGDQVVLSWIRGEGMEAGGSVYDWDGKKVNAGGVTTFQRHAVVSENRLTLVPKGMGMDIAVLLGCSAPTGMGAILNVLNVKADNSVVVFGTGGIGLNAIMAAAHVGGNPVIGVDINAARRDLALAFGATHVIDPAAGDTRAQINAIAPRGIDVIGNARHDAVFTISPSVFNEGKSLLGTWGGDSIPERDYARYASLLTNGRYAVRQLLSTPYRLEDINQALDDFRTGMITRPLIDMSKG